jgi:hypothetical protein
VPSSKSSVKLSLPTSTATRGSDGWVVVPAPDAQLDSPGPAVLHAEGIEVFVELAPDPPPKAPHAPRAPRVPPKARRASRYDYPFPSERNWDGRFDGDAAHSQALARRSVATYVSTGKWSDRARRRWTMWVVLGCVLGIGGVVGFLVGLLA